MPASGCRPNAHRSTAVVRGCPGDGCLLRTLADPTRTRILHALALAPELCVCDLALLLDLSVSALSHQLRLLRERGAVTRRKVGRIAFYALADEHVRHVLADALAHTAEPLSQTA